MVDVVAFAALAWEAGVVLDALQAVESSGPRTWRGYLGDGAVVMVRQTGVGSLRGVRAAEGAPAGGLYLSIGCAGALVGGLHGGDIVLGDRVVALAPDQAPVGEVGLAADGIANWAAMRGVALRRGPVASSPSVLGTRAEKVRASRTGALVVDMECAGVAAVADRRGIPVGAIKVVLDELGDAIAVPAPDLIDVETGDLRPGRAIVALATRPHAWGSALRLAHQQRTAERRLRDLVAPLFSAGLDGLGMAAGGARATVPA